MTGSCSRPYNECEWFFFRTSSPGTLSMSGQVLARFGDSASRAVASPPLERRADLPEAPLRTSVRLSSLGRDARGTVAGVRVHAPGIDGALDPDLERMALRLIEIGFVQGA